MREVMRESHAGGAGCFRVINGYELKRTEGLVAGSEGPPSVHRIMRLARGEMSNADWKVMQYFILMGCVLSRSGIKRLRNGYDRRISHSVVA